VLHTAAPKCEQRQLSTLLKAGYGFTNGLNLDPALRKFCFLYFTGMLRRDQQMQLSQTCQTVGSKSR